MTIQKVSIFSLFKKSYSVTVQSLQKDHRIYLPFLIFAGIEALSLIFFYLAPREPLRAATGPFISTLWGEQFLHYPQNFVLLPKLAGFARMSLSVLIGSLLTGIAVAFLYKKPLSNAVNKYVSLFLIFVILTALYYFLNKAFLVFLVKYFNAGHSKFLFIGPRWWLGLFSPVISQFFALILQAIFVYAVPIILLTEKKVFGAITGSCVFFFRHFFVTLFLVGIPMLIAVPLIFLNYNSVFLMGLFTPEITLWVCLLGIIINSLIIDPMITLTTATFYSENRGKE